MTDQELVAQVNAIGNDPLRLERDSLRNAYYERIGIGQDTARCLECGRVLHTGFELEQHRRDHRERTF